MTITDPEHDAAPRALGSLLFRPPSLPPEEGEHPIPGPSSSPETTTEQLLDPPAGSPSGSESPAGEWSDPSGADPTSWTDSSAADDAPAGPAGIVGKKALQKTFRQGVLIGTGVAHKFAARTEGQQRAGLYLADDEDAANIGDPLASIAHRRGGVAGKLSPDANDALQGLLGFGGYVAKQFAKWQTALEVDRQLAGQPPLNGPVDL